MIMDPKAAKVPRKRYMLMAPKGQKYSVAAFFRQLFRKPRIPYQRNLKRYERPGTIPQEPSSGSKA